MVLITGSFLADKTAFGKLAQRTLYRRLVSRLLIGRWMDLKLPNKTGKTLEILQL